MNTNIACKSSAKLMKLMAKIIDEIESSETEETEKIKILAKLCDIIYKVRKLEDEVSNSVRDESPENYILKASEISIIEDYIEKIKRVKGDKGEKTW